MLLTHMPSTNSSSFCEDADDGNSSSPNQPSNFSLFFSFSHISQLHLTRSGTFNSTAKRIIRYKYLPLSTICRTQLFPFSDTCHASVYGWNWRAQRKGGNNFHWRAHILSHKNTSKQPGKHSLSAYTEVHTRASLTTGQWLKDASILSCETRAHCPSVHLTASIVAALLASVRCVHEWMNKYSTLSVSPSLKHKIEYKFHSWM